MSDDRERTRYDAQDAADAVIADLRAQLASAQAEGAVKMRDLIVELLGNSARSAEAMPGWGLKAAKFIRAKAEFISQITGEEATAAALAAAPEGGQ